MALTTCILALAGCKSGNARKALLPEVSGKAGEVLVVLDKGNWEGQLGEDIRDILAADCPFLPLREPLYTLVNVAPSAFNDLFRVHRNIVYLYLSSSVDENRIDYLSDAYASPQCLVRVSARTAADASALIKEQGAKMVAALEQAERDRVISNARKYEQRDIAPKVAKVFGGSIHFPAGYQLRKITDNFAWAQYDTQNSTLGLLVYKYPVEPGQEEFSLERLVQKRNEIMKDNVPGGREGSYMVTAGPEAFPPYVEYIKYKGREFAQLRGLWEMEGDFMGGPFVSEAFYSLDGKDIIVTEAFVYNPSKNKRQLLRQVESILYAWDWVKEEEKK